MHIKEGGYTYGGQNLILLARNGVEERHIRLKMSAAQKIS